MRPRNPITTFELKRKKPISRALQYCSTARSTSVPGSTINTFSSVLVISKEMEKEFWECGRSKDQVSTFINTLGCATAGGIQKAHLETHQPPLRVTSPGMLLMRSNPRRHNNPIFCNWIVGETYANRTLDFTVEFTVDFCRSRISLLDAEDHHVRRPAPSLPATAQCSGRLPYLRWYQHTIKCSMIPIQTRR